jgi:hypothetical protein
LSRKRNGHAANARNPQPQGKQKSFARARKRFRAEAGSTPIETNKTGRIPELSAQIALVALEFETAAAITVILIRTRKSGETTAAIAAHGQSSRAASFESFQRNSASCAKTSERPA